MWKERDSGHTDGAARGAERSVHTLLHPDRRHLALHGCTTPAYISVCIPLVKEGSQIFLITKSQGPAKTESTKQSSP